MQANVAKRHRPFCRYHTHLPTDAMRRSRFIAIVLALLMPAAPAWAQSANPDVEPAVPQIFDWFDADDIAANTPWGQQVDVESTRRILSWTTMPEYTNPLVDHLPHDARIVSPTDHFGSPIGEPGVLHDTDEILDYFTALSASSGRVRLEELGRSEEGNRISLVQVGSERNLARLEEVRRGMGALADPRGTSAEEARRLIDELPVLYTLYAGLHSSETGSPEMVMELAHRLAVSDDPLIRTVRDSTVVFIVPVADPDGRDRVVQWHQRHNADVYQWEDRVPGPPYWGSYIFHDINRDGLQLSSRTNSLLVDLFLEWNHPIGHDLHESVPYLYVSTGTGPYNPTVDPITVSEWQWFSNFEVTALTSLGMPGVWTHDFYDGWYPGYLLWVTNTRNAMGRFYETFGSSVPNTMERTVGTNRTSVEWFRPNPPRDTTMWSLRNNTNYMQSGVLNALYLTSQNRSRVLEQFWTKSNNSLNRGRDEAPYAWVIPVDQARKADAAYMLNLLRRQGIEVHRADAAGAYGDVSVASGDYVVRMDQPYRNFIQTLMDVQHFPEDAPRPYDDVAWTFPLMFNVEVHAVEEVGVRELAMTEMTEEAVLSGSAVRERRGGDWYVVPPSASAHAVRARYALGDVPVYTTGDSLPLSGGTVAPGAWLIDANDLPWDDAEGWAGEHGLELTGVPATALAEVERDRLELPRIAMLHTWLRTQDDGWVRYAFDHLEIPFTYIGEDRIGEMDLRAEFDVILFPTQGRGTGGRTIFEGVDPRYGPLPYTRTAEFPSHGHPAETEDMTGGMGFEGLAALRDFVENGGTLITLGSASNLPLEFGLVRGISSGSAGDLFVPGSIVQAEATRPHHPVTYGYGETMPVFHQFGPYLDVPERLESNIVLRYAGEDELFLSGLVQNPGQLAGQPAAVSMPVGEGHIVLFGFNPLHRFQTHGTFAMVWNAIMHWDRLDVGLEGDVEEAVAGE